MPKRPFRVGRSHTGLGIFATRPIRKRLRIAEYKGRKLATKEANKIEARGNLYLYEINSRWTIDGTPRSNIARYFNHSCNPNAEIYDVGHKVFIRTLRNIKPGEEITYDYGIDYLRNVIGLLELQMRPLPPAPRPQGPRAPCAAQAPTGAAGGQTAEQTLERLQMGKAAIPFGPCPALRGHARRCVFAWGSFTGDIRSTSACPPRAPTACRAAFSI